MRQVWMVAAFAVLGACNGEDAEETDAITAGDGASAECGSTPPVIEELVVSDAGMSTGDECGDSIRPMIRVQANSSDADGDLHYWTLRVWWDDVIDSQESGEYAEVGGTSGEDCRVSTAQLAMKLCVTGDPPFSTPMEFGAVLFDDEDNASNGGEPIFATFTTPDESGTYESGSGPQ